MTGAERGLSGRVAVVTGAAGGIGSAVCAGLVQRGAIVAVLDRDQEGAATIADRLRLGGGTAESFTCRLDDESEVGRTVEAVIDRMGPVRILCNTAGSVCRAAVTDMTLVEWERSLADNLTSIFLVSRAVIPQMVGAGGGSIVNMASGWGIRAGRHAAAYCAAKGGVVMLTKAMAVDHAPLVRVNCVAPGDIRTRMLFDEANQVGQTYSEFVNAATARPLQRIGEADEVAEVVCFLAGEASSFVTGAVISVDGGGTA